MLNIDQNYFCNLARKARLMAYDGPQENSFSAFYRVYTEGWESADSVF
jgi:hypothetical protein